MRISLNMKQEKDDNSSRWLYDKLSLQDKAREDFIRGSWTYKPKSKIHKELVKLIRLMQEDKMKRTITRRFYRGAPNFEVFSTTLAEATEQAKKYLQEHPLCEEITVVEIIRVVRRREEPIVIEEVRR